jgi:DNA polymerase III delta subunit
VQILALLGWQLHVLALIKTAGSRDIGAIAAEAKLNPYVVRKSTAIADRMTFAELKLLVRRVTELDVRLKSEPIDADDAMLELITSLNA